MREKPQPIPGSPVVTVSPSSGEGPASVFTMTLDPADHLGNTVGLLINHRLDGVASCYVTYDFGSSNFYLINDAGNLEVPSPPGASEIQNRQCVLSASSSTAEIQERALVLRLSITFKPSFGGPKNLYAFTVIGNKAAFQPAGSWMVAP